MVMKHKQVLGAIELTVDGVGVIIRGRRVFRWWEFWSGFAQEVDKLIRTEIKMKVTVGHNIAMSITYLDQNGNPMLTMPTPDSAPVWSKTAADTIDTLSVAASGATAELDTVAPGADTVSLSVVVAGQTFGATLDVEIDPVPQVLTSVEIAASVN